jgi:hypothetical protein
VQEQALQAQLKGSQEEHGELQKFKVSSSRFKVAAFYCDIEP